jgi:hypothetical protein
MINFIIEILIKMASILLIAYIFGENYSFNLRGRMFLNTFIILF